MLNELLVYVLFDQTVAKTTLKKGKTIILKFPFKFLFNNEMSC